MNYAKLNKTDLGSPDVCRQAKKFCRQNVYGGKIEKQRAADEQNWVSFSELEQNWVSFLSKRCQNPTYTHFFLV